MFGVASMTARLRKVAVRRPGPSLQNADPALWNYGPEFDPEKLKTNHASFVKLLENTGTDIYWMEQEDNGNADAVFTYDASLITPSGAILMSPGKRLRQNEQEIHRQFYQLHNIPVIGEVTGKARAEAGDTLWLDEITLVVGRGFRTNQAGIEQLRQIVEPAKIDIHVFDLPVYLGAAACLHLMSLVSLVDTKTALICKPLLPVGLWELLTSKGFSLIEAPYGEFAQSHTLSTNVLAIAPGQCIMLDGLPQTRAAVEKAGIKLQVFDGKALCIGCEGGPTCLTRPLHREGA